MSEHRYVFELFAYGRKARATDGVKAAKKLQAWLARKLADEVTDRDFAKQIAAHLKRHPPRAKSKTVEVVLTDRKGTARITHDATVHAIQGWLSDQREMYGADELVGLRLPPADERVMGPFVVHDQRIARVVHANGIELELDDSTVPIPSTNRTALRRMWQSGICRCPACAREPEESKPSGFVAALADAFSPSGYRRASYPIEAHRVFFQREVVHLGVKHVEHLTFCKRIPGLVVEASCYPACEHGDANEWPVEIMTTTAVKVAEIQAWVKTARASIEASAARVTKRALRGAATAAREHTKLERLGAEWWTAKGHALSDDAFKLGRVNGVLAIPAREAFEKYARKTIRRAKNSCLTTVWHSVVLPRWAAR